VVDRLAAEMLRAVEKPEVKAAFAKLGIVPLAASARNDLERRRAARSAHRRAMRRASSWSSTIARSPFPSARGTGALIRSATCSPIRASGCCSSCPAAWRRCASTAAPASRVSQVCFRRWPCRERCRSSPRCLLDQAKPAQLLAEVEASVRESYRNQLY